jgi:acyl carrier protein
MFPSLDEVIGELRTISEDDTIEPGSLLATVDVDSLDILEWVYEIEERAGIQFDESLYEREVLENATVAELYDRLRAQSER